MEPKVHTTSKLRRLAPVLLSVVAASAGVDIALRLNEPAPPRDEKVRQADHASTEQSHPASQEDVTAPDTISPAVPNEVVPEAGPDRAQERAEAQNPADDRVEAQQPSDDGAGPTVSPVAPAAPQTAEATPDVEEARPATDDGSVDL